MTAMWIRAIHHCLRSYIPLFPAHQIEFGPCGCQDLCLPAANAGAMPSIRQHVTSCLTKDDPYLPPIPPRVPGKSRIKTCFHHFTLNSGAEEKSKYSQQEQGYNELIPWWISFYQQFKGSDLNTESSRKKYHVRKQRASISPSFPVPVSIFVSPSVAPWHFGKFWLRHHCLVQDWHGLFGLSGRLRWSIV